MTSPSESRIALLNWHKEKIHVVPADWCPACIQIRRIEAAALIAARDEGRKDERINTLSELNRRIGREGARTYEKVTRLIDRMMVEAYND